MTVFRSSRMAPARPSPDCISWACIFSASGSPPTFLGVAEDATVLAETLSGRLVTRAATWALGVVYAAAWAIAGWLWNGPPSDLDNFFLPAVRIVLSGHRC